MRASSELHRIHFFRQNSVDRFRRKKFQNTEVEKISNEKRFDRETDSIQSK